MLRFGTCTLVGLSALFALAQGFISLPEDDTEGRKCIGLEADFSRVEDVDNDYLELIQSPQGNRVFTISSVNRVTRADSNELLSERVRLEERIEGVKIHGADVVVSFEGCESGICPLNVKGLEGKTFKTINVTHGYIASVSEEEAAATIMEEFDVSATAVGTLTLRVFVATSGDYLAYFTDVLVEKEDDVRYYHVIVDAHSLEFLSICSLVDSSPGRSKRGQGPGRYLRQEDARVQPNISPTGINCASCASDSEGISWGSKNSFCPINSLYLNDTGKQTICLEGTDENGQTVYGAGAVPELHWNGTNDCKSTTDQCRPVVLPECSDAISDVQFAAIKTLQYFQEYLGVMGGLSAGADNPVPIQANVHYNHLYCNAFYRFSVNTVFFGDCDCSYWTPMTSIDIVAHEIAHGLTRHTSSLEYQYQSGGLNEAFSDVVGAVVEFLVNDSLDTPDFDVGESLGNRLRSMEFPEQGTTAISSVCDYSNRLSVHSTSGPLNKAFVNSVRACEANGCSDERECTILLGTIYMYANVQSLTSYSGYLDAARAICSIVDEYFAAKAPKTKCTADQVTGFIKQGWASVNVALDDTCQSRNCCSGGCPTFDSTKESSGPTPLFSSKPTASPTTLRPTLTPHIPVLTQPPVSSEPDDTATSSDSIILRVANLLRGIFNVWSTFFG